MYVIINKDRRELVLQSETFMECSLALDYQYSDPQYSMMTLQQWEFISHA